MGYKLLFVLTGNIKNHDAGSVGMALTSQVLDFDIRVDAEVAERRIMKDYPGSITRLYE